MHYLITIFGKFEHVKLELEHILRVLNGYKKKVPTKAISVRYWVAKSSDLRWSKYSILIKRVRKVSFSENFAIVLNQWSLPNVNSLMILKIMETDKPSNFLIINCERLSRLIKLSKYCWGNYLISFRCLYAVPTHTGCLYQHVE